MFSLVRVYNPIALYCSYNLISSRYLPLPITQIKAIDLALRYDCVMCCQPSSSHPKIVPLPYYLFLDGFKRKSTQIIIYGYVKILFPATITKLNRKKNFILCLSNWIFINFFPIDNIKCFLLFNLLP